MDVVRWFDETSMDDVAVVGGKNASLGEMYRRLADRGIRVPNGFATTASAFRDFLRARGLTNLASETLAGWDGVDVDDLAERARRIRTAIASAPLTDELTEALVDAYRKLSVDAGAPAVDVAVRSSATAEDLPEASFAGQQETYLMVHGIGDVCAAVRKCFASLYTARAISYRRDMGIDESDVALCVGVQRMVRSDLASSGVMFTLDTESGLRDVVYVTSTWGLGETIVQGRVIPDGFHVHKSRLRDGFRPLIGRTLGPKEIRMGYDETTHRLVNEPTAPDDRRRFSVSDDEVLQLAEWGLVIEDHYSEARGTDTPMDIEWAKDGITGELFIVQARPETVHSRRAPDSISAVHRLETTSELLASGLAVGDRVAAGTVRRVADPRDMGRVRAGDVIVTDVTDPDWEPVLKTAAAIVTERGGRTSHAAIVARELGIPAVVGTGPIEPERLADGTPVTVSCAEGDEGHVWSGTLPFTVELIDAAQLPATRTDIMLNLGDPSAAFSRAQLPSAGVGLVRMEFVFAGHVGVHPLALTRIDTLDPAVRHEVEERIGEADPEEFFVDRLAQGVGQIAAAFWPRPVIVRFSDFKTNEYANLLGGTDFEPIEPNPMIGWRGASRYHHPDFRDGFDLEVAAMKRVREELGFTNVKLMVPFCRTPDEGRRVLEVLADGGLVRGEHELEVYVMVEVPANVLRADEFAELFDGFSIGSNDLTQLTLGVDRDSDTVADLFDERDPAVERACSMAIDAAKAAGIRVGICGQAPSDHPDFAAFLVGQGIDSISVTPDALARTMDVVADAEAAGA
ncbi:MAG: phosphoenolpyruvate synthase [Actinomycetota bacterium]